MSDTGATAVSSCDNYRDLIQEVFINPIRSVLIVDDEFPTFDVMLADFLSADKKSHAKSTVTTDNAERVSKLMSYCRDSDRNWLVDVHDGRGIENTDGEEPITHLHQSDLLVLDYNLVRDSADQGKAISILRSLAESVHFNLVVVYTQEDISNVFKGIVLSLLTKWKDIVLPENSNVGKKVSEWEDIDDSILKQLEDCVTKDTYLRFRRRTKNAEIDVCADDPDVKRFKDLFAKKPDNVKLRERSLFKWLLFQAERKLEKQLSSNGFGDVTWSKDHEIVNWIRTNQLFITVVPKEVSAEELPRKLLDALTAWGPQPPRLIMSKMRTELDARGVNAEDDALSDELIQAIWFLELLRANDDERPSMIATSISRHWEGLLGAVQTNVIKFANRLFAHLQCDPSKHHDCVEEHFSVDLQDHDRQVDALLRQNAYNCSKPPEGWHLTTGHVLKMDEEYWVVLSPACDLVPEQKDNERFTALRPTMPFKAVKLQSFGKKKDSKTEALKKANSNMCVFLKIDNGVQPFQFTAINQHLANPVWEEMFAADFGRFDQESGTMKVARLRWNDETNRPECKWNDVKIIAQLRYEYALNLLMRLGSTLSRIGLDFVEFREGKAPENTLGQIHGQTVA
ncbi:MAG: response regulator receiver domain [Syntrophobacteraceae bacterium]